MDRDSALAVLRRAETYLRARGVAHAGLFGSVARRDTIPGSDIDVLVELDAGRHLSLFDYAGIKLAIEDLFEGDVDVVESKGLKPRLRDPIAADLIYAF